MPDEPAGQNAGAQAQALGADILAKLDELIQPQHGLGGQGVPLEERKRLAKLAIDKMNAIVADYLAQAEVQRVEAQQASSASAEEKIARLKASIGA